MTDSKNTDHVEEQLIEISCFEPAGTTVSMSALDLSGHTLVTGGSGSGKTTRIIYPMLKQLLESNASRVESKIGLCVLDTKGDGEMTAYIRKVSMESGRSKDLCVIDCESDSYIDLLEPVKQTGIKGVEVISGLLAAFIPESETNRYWEVTFESILLLSLRLYFLSAEPPSYSGMVAFLVRYILQFDVMSDDFKGVIERLKESVASKDDAVINETLAGHRMWKTLDLRTRSIFQSMASPLMNSLSSETSRKLFSGEQTSSVHDVASLGGILVVSIDAIREPIVGGLVATIVKGQFYDSILNRQYRGRESQRLAGLVMDDWPICATGGVNSRYSDVSALGMIRSRRGFVLAATQGLSALDLKIGITSRRAAISNFSNLFFFRGRDSELDVFASSYLGEKKRILIDRTKPVNEPASRRQTQAMVYERETFVPAVPIGALAQLSLGEAYALIGGQIYSQALCLVPEYAPEQEMEAKNELEH